MFKLTIETENAAFHDGAEPAVEVALILRNVTRKLEAGQLEGGCFDTNGNRCGSWELTRE